MLHHLQQPQSSNPLLALLTCTESCTSTRNRGIEKYVVVVVVGGGGVVVAAAVVFVV